MITSHLLLLVLNLSVLKCSSILKAYGPGLETVSGDPAASVSVADTSASATEQSSAIVTTQEHRDMFSRYLTVELFHKVLEYVANSPKLMSNTSKTLRDFAGQTRIYRFYEGAYWDMPELANVWKFGEEVNDDLEALMDERKIITELGNNSHYDRAFNENLSCSLVGFKKLAYPVLKYLIRVFKFHTDPRVWIDDGDMILGKDLFNTAIRLKRYDLIYELIIKFGYPFLFDFGFSSGYEYPYVDDLVLLNVKFYFDYFSWAYKYNPSAFKHVSEEMCPLSMIYTLITEPERKICIEFKKSVWIAFCIQNQLPESYYVEDFASSPEGFYEVIQLYVCSYNMINLDPVEMDNSHAKTNSLIKRFCLDERVTFLELLNDVRFGSEDLEIYQNRILPRTGLNKNMISRLIMAASKANKKNLVIELSNHPEFCIRVLEETIGLGNPHSFKAFFDILERRTLENYIHINFAESLKKLIKMIFSNNLKIISITSVENGNLNKFEIETSSEYRELGFATIYEFFLAKEEYDDFRIKAKMFNDFAEAGAVEFARLITNNFGGPASEIIEGYSVNVSYEFIRLLLENEPLIVMLRNHNIRVYCDYERISYESIANFSQVINLGRAVWNQ